MYKKKDKKYDITQGDIFQKFNYVKWAELKGGSLDIDEVDIPFFVVLTQSCDLEQDFIDGNKPKDEIRDKYMHSILVCPAYLAELVREGKHLQKLGFKMEYLNTDRWKIIKQNKNIRYHFLQKKEELGLPELVIDFKHYYTIPSTILYRIWEKHYIGTLKPLFREDVTLRFANFLSRIGLPNVKNETE